MTVDKSDPELRNPSNNKKKTLLRSKILPFLSGDSPDASSSWAKNPAAILQIADYQAAKSTLSGYSTLIHPR